MPPEVVVGVVGAGRVAGLRHLPAIARVPGVRVAALADADPGRLAELGDRFGIAGRYPGVHELLDREEEVDAVVVCVPAAHHAEVAITALEQDRHVLLEKPLCLSLDDADRLAAAAGRSAGRLLLAFNVRRHPFVRRARELLAAGALGEPVALATTWTSTFYDRPVASPWRKLRPAGGGVLCELAPHHVDLWRFVLGHEVDEVCAVSCSGPWDDETLALAARSSGGVALSGIVSQRSVDANELVLHGTEARLRLDLYRADGLEVRRGDVMPGDPWPRVKAAAGSVRTLGGRALRRGLPDYEQTYVDEWLHFADVVRGTTEPDCTVADGVHNLEVILAASASASKGRSVRVADAPRTLEPVAP